MSNYLMDKDELKMMMLACVLARVCVCVGAGGGGGGMLVSVVQKRKTKGFTGGWRDSVSVCVCVCVCVCVGACVFFRCAPELFVPFLMDSAFVAPLRVTCSDTNTSTHTHICIL